jgi:fermentation-respiration switch protein FrsA (DUF1100 family)
MAPAFEFTARWEAGAGPRVMAAWRRRGTLPVYHYALRRELPLSIALIDEAARFEAEPDPPCPALVLHGRRDDAVPLATSEAFVARRPDRRRLVVYDAGHELIEVQEPMWTEATAFLDRLGASA